MRQRSVHNIIYYYVGNIICGGIEGTRRKSARATRGLKICPVLSTDRRGGVNCSGLPPGMYMIFVFPPVPAKMAPRAVKKKGPVCFGPIIPKYFPTNLRHGVRRPPKSDPPPPSAGSRAIGAKATIRPGRIQLK